jgi:hypothetical protein
MNDLVSEYTPYYGCCCGDEDYGEEEENWFIAYTIY